MEILLIITLVLTLIVGTVFIVDGAIGFRIPDTISSTLVVVMGVLLIAAIALSSMLISARIG